MITHGAGQTFAARMTGLPQAAEFVDAFCQRCGVADDEALRLHLVIEELFTNTVSHGHGGDSDATIRLEVEFNAASLGLIYEDQAPPFDPVQHLAQRPPELDVSADHRSVGGLGLHLVAQLAQCLNYARVGDCNRLFLQLRRTH